MSSTAQIPLFDLGIDLRAAAAVKERIMNAEYAPNTLRDYRCAWGRFADWCRQAARDSLPAVPQTLVDHAAWCIAQGYRLETVYQRMTAVGFHHRRASLPSPFDATVREFLRNARRALQERPRGKAALTVDWLKRISRKLLYSRSPLDARDRAMIVLGFACGWRSEEMVSLDVSDVLFAPGGITLRLGKSKTDQEGRGRLAGIRFGRAAITCPVRALNDWLRVRGRWAGALFVGFGPGHVIIRERLHKDGLRRAVKRGIELIGEDARPYGAHSLRVGMATAAAEAGASAFAIMQLGGWRSIHTVLRYIRPAKAFRSYAMARVL